MNIYFKKNLKLVLIMLCAVIVVILWNNRKNVSPDNVLTFLQNSFINIGKGKEFPYEIIGNKINKENFKVIGKNIVAVSDTSFLYLNESAKELVNKQHSFSSPIINVNSNNILVYNLYGNAYQIGDNNNNVKNTENKIMTGAISDNGIYGFITESSGYFCQMEIYPKYQEDKYYKYYFSECYIVGMDFSEAGKGIATIGCSAENGSIKSMLYVFDYGLDTPILKVEYVGSTLMNVLWLLNGNIAVVGDDIVSIVNVKTGKRKDINFKGELLTSFYINRKDGIAFSLSSSSDGTNCKVHVVNNEGQSIFENETEEKIIDLFYKSNDLVILSSEKAVKCNILNKRKKEIDIKNNAKSVQMFSPKEGYVLYTNEVRKIIF